MYITKGTIIKYLKDKCVPILSGNHIPVEIHGAQRDDVSIWSWSCESPTKLDEVKPFYWAFGPDSHNGLTNFLDGDFYFVEVHQVKESGQ